MEYIIIFIMKILGYFWGVTRPMFGLDIFLVKSILYKRIVTKFFWDYYINIQVCNICKRVVIELLWIVIKCFIFIF